MGQLQPRRRDLNRADVMISSLELPGEEPAVVLLHGLAGSANEFERSARALAGRKVILVDQRGHGRSTRRPADLSREAFVADVIDVIKGGSNGPVDLVGQSMGAHTAMLVAAARPDLVRKLVLLEGDQGSGTPADHEALGAFFAGWEAPFATREEAAASLGGSALAEAWAADMEETADGLRPRFDADVMVEAISHVAVPRWDEWRSVAAPTMVVYGDRGMFSESQQAAFVAANSNAARVVLSDASHDAHLDAHEDWVRALQAFLGVN